MSKLEDIIERRRRIYDNIVRVHEFASQSDLFPPEVLSQPRSFTKKPTKQQRLADEIPVDPHALTRRYGL